MAWVGRSMLTALLAATLAGADRPLPVDDPWRAIDELRFEDAVRIARTDASPSARLAEATALIQLQPVTRDNLASAERLLRELLSGTDVEIAIAARYQLARLLQLNPFGPDLPAAVEQFEILERQHPQHRLAEAAVVRRAIIQLHTASDPERRLELFEAFERRAESLADPVSRRDMHMTLAGVAARYSMPPAVALRHLKAVDVAAVAKDRSLADLLVRRGETARHAGDTDEAKRSYEAFLARFPSDQRTYFIRQQLQSLSRTEDGR